MAVLSVTHLPLNGHDVRVALLQVDLQVTPLHQQGTPARLVQTRDDHFWAQRQMILQLALVEGVRVAVGTSNERTFTLIWARRTKALNAVGQVEVGVHLHIPSQLAHQLNERMK